MGRYVLTPDIFDMIDETEPGVGGEIQLTDALQKLDSIYGVTFRQRPVTRKQLEWLQHQSSLRWMTRSSGMTWWTT